MHAHSEALARAAKVLQSIARDDVSQRRSLDQEGREGSWQYLGKASGVRIYSRSDQSFPELPRSLDATQSSDSGLPFFRGEGLIEGDWRIADVMATLASTGARSIWDERFNNSTSSVAAILSDTDILMHNFYLASFPIGQRDVVQACSIVYPTPTTGMYIGCSVEDPIVPVGRMPRSYVSLLGWVFRYRDAEEEEEETEEEELLEFDPFSKRSHNKTLSRMYEPLSHTLPNLSRRSMLPASEFSGNMATATSHIPRASIAHRHSQSLAEPGGHSMRHRSKFSKDLIDGMDFKKPPKPVQTGIKATFVLRTNPGGSLPATLINQMNTHVPLCIATLNKYLKTYGFAPHLVSRKGLVILSEEFDPHSHYALIFKTDDNRPPTDPIELRFHGLGFSEGRFEISVLGAHDWTLLHDFPDADDAKTKPSNAPTESEKTTTPKQTPRPRFSQRFSSPKVKGHRDTAPDPARLPGTQGGCTLRIVPPSQEPKRLVQIRISKRPRNRLEAVIDIAKTGELLTEAAHRADALIEEQEQEEFHHRMHLEPGEKELRRANAVLQAMRTAMNSRRYMAGCV